MSDDITFIPPERIPEFCTCVCGWYRFRSAWCCHTYQIHPVYCEASKSQRGPLVFCTDPPPEMTFENVYVEDSGQFCQDCYAKKYGADYATSGYFDVIPPARAVTPTVARQGATSAKAKTQVSGKGGDGTRLPAKGSGHKPTVTSNKQRDPAQGRIQPAQAGKKPSHGTTGSQETADKSRHPVDERKPPKPTSSSGRQAVAADGVSLVEQLDQLSISAAKRNEARK